MHPRYTRDWLNAVDPGSEPLTRFMRALWQRYPSASRGLDPRNPEHRRRFYDWATREAPRRMPIHGDFLPVGIEPGADGIARPIFAPPAPPPPSPRPFGVNVVGLSQLVSGTAESLRALCRTLGDARIPFCIIDYGARHRPAEAAGLAGAVDRTLDPYLAEAPKYAINLLVEAPSMFPALHAALGTGFFAGSRTIAWFAWELPEAPALWQGYADVIQEIWTPSRFCAEAFRRRFPALPVHAIPYAIDPPGPRALTDAPALRAELGIAPSTFLVGFAFAARSFVARKNPDGAIRAFRHAFPEGTQDAAFLLKSTGLAQDPATRARLAEAAEGDPRIRLIDDVWPPARMAAFTAAIDCYLSLHRSEGFGFGPATAMAAGKPVVLTDWSGTTDFADTEAACPVPYRLVPVAPGAYPHGAGQKWADPDEDAAAASLRRLAAEPEFARAIGETGRAQIAERCDPRRVAAELRAKLCAAFCPRS